MHSVDLLVESICGNLKVLQQKYFGSLMSLILVYSKTNFQNNQIFFPVYIENFPNDDLLVELSCVILKVFPEEYFGSLSFNVLHILNFGLYPNF